VKNTNSAEQKGYDAGKKVSGIKRHIAVDMLGLPHAIEVTTAEVIDAPVQWSCAYFTGLGVLTLSEPICTGTVNREANPGCKDRSKLPSMALDARVLRA